MTKKEKDAAKEQAQKQINDLKNKNYELSNKLLERNIEIERLEFKMVQARKATEKLISVNNHLQNEIIKAKNWAHLRNEQVGKLIDAIALNAETENIKTCLEVID